jgi:dihydrofolate synthase/folylpolyglutamate synthase
VLLDGAHNIGGIKVLAAAIKQDFTYNRLILVLGILADKNIREMVEIIVPISDVVIATKSSNPRACEPEKLKKIVLEIVPDKEIITRDRILDAVKYAKSISKKGDLICVTGSLFTVAEAKNLS